jgi:hypothetical protein
VQIVFFLLYGNVQVALAFLLSCFFSSPRFANVALWVWVLGTGIFAHFLLDNVYQDNDQWVEFLQLIPTVGLHR